MSDTESIALVQLRMLNDNTTPYEFVIELLEDVFGRSSLDAKLLATTAHHYGEADCGVWPKVVADALLEEAQARIEKKGHTLTFTRSEKGGAKVVGQEFCDVCGKPEVQARALFRKSGLVICDECILEGAQFLSASIKDTEFQYTHEVLEWHFEGTSLSSLETSVRKFPLRMRADLQLAFDAILSTATIKQLGIKSGWRLDSIEFADLWEAGRNAKTIVPIQYTELDIGEEVPRRCVGTALWLLDENGLKHSVVVSQDEGTRGEHQVKVEIAVPRGQAGADLAASYFRDIEKVIDKAQTYRGKVLSLETQNQWRGFADGVTIHHLPEIARESVILPQKTLALLDRNILDFAASRARLRAMGQSSKKGLLFYGPPGTGKTHTIQYLASSLPKHTTLLVTADQVCLLHEYFSLARLLQPSVLVIEDADLIAREREEMGGPAEEALLNKLLNEMDGLRQDCEVFFILTTNRPEQIEKALAGRPGRIDQAIEFPLPDHDGRSRLAELYCGDLNFGPSVLQRVVEQTEGTSGAFIKELMRRIAQRVIEDPSSTGEVAEYHVSAAIDEMIFEGGTLNAQLLGAGAAAH